MEKEFGSRSRSEIINATEWAAEKMALQVENYISLYERLPFSIGVRGEKYPLEYCASVLRQELKNRKISSQVEVLANGGGREIVFNLDEFADRYFEDEDFQKIKDIWE